MARQPANGARPARRNRAEEMKKIGRYLLAVEISTDLGGLIDRVADHLGTAMAAVGVERRCTQREAVEAMLREGGKKILGKTSKGD